MHFRGTYAYMMAIRTAGRVEKGGGIRVLCGALGVFLIAAACSQAGPGGAPETNQTQLEVQARTVAGAAVAGASLQVQVFGRDSTLHETANGITNSAGTYLMVISLPFSGKLPVEISVTPPPSSALRAVQVRDSAEFMRASATRRTVTVTLSP